MCIRDRYMQDAFRQALDPENDRKIKPSPDGVYLMKKVTAPAVIAECGFLSNPQEAEKLGQDPYQTKASLAIVSSYLRFAREKAVSYTHLDVYKRQVLIQERPWALWGSRAAAKAPWPASSPGCGMPHRAISLSLIHIYHPRRFRPGGSQCRSQCDHAHRRHAGI